MQAPVAFVAADSSRRGGEVPPLERWRGLAEQLAAATSGMGQRRQRVQIDQFEALEVPLPDIPTQRRIGAELRLAEVEELAARRATLSAALLPAARNEAFATLT